jgi:hypothetical protein
MKTPFKILILITLATLLIWPSLGYMYDPKEVTAGWYLLSLAIEILIGIAYVLFRNPMKD